ncbi:serine protease [Clostridium perfringens]|nr:serine protease [Clostridium perfringens]
MQKVEFFRILFYFKKVINIFSKNDDELKKAFYALKSRNDLANLLEIEEKTLRYFLYGKSDDDKYNTFEIPKKNGQFRKIAAPISPLKTIQRKLTYVLSLVYKVKPCAYGFLKDRNIKSNAKNHSKKKVLLNIDLKDFFSQVHFGRIRGMLISKPYDIGIEAATSIAQLTCYKGVLAQGAPSSPILTNMICSPMDTQLIKLAKKYKLQYTRYADDITFSNYNEQFPQGIIKGEINNLIIGDELNNILTKNGFEVNMNKVFLNDNFTRQEVTGLIVNKFPNVKREYVKSLRAILYNCSRDGVYNTAKEYISKGFCKNKNVLENQDNEELVINWFKMVLKGKIDFIKEIRGSNNNIFLKYAQILNKVFNEDIYDLNILNKLTNNVVILNYEDNKCMIQGSGFFVKDVGLFTSYHVTESGAFFSVKTQSLETIGSVANEFNEISKDKRIDYAIYDIKKSTIEGFEVGNSKDIKVGDKVIIIGYPEYQEKDTPTIQTCNITSMTTYLKAPLCIVSGRIIHGASGGVVLDMNHKAIGIIKAGAASTEKEYKGKQGFIPIHLALEHMKNNKKSISN